MRYHNKNKADKKITTAAKTKQKNLTEDFLSPQILKRMFMRIFAERKTANN